MKILFLYFLVGSLCFYSPFSYSQKEKCESQMRTNFSSGNTETLMTGNQKIVKNFLKKLSGKFKSNNKNISSLQRESEKDNERKTSYLKLSKYFIVLGVMLTGSYITAYIASTVGQENTGLTIFLGQFVGLLSALGIYSLGAYAYESVNSKGRKIGFGKPQKDFGLSHSDLSEKFEGLWAEMNKFHSMNAQMARNVLERVNFLARESARDAQLAFAKDNYDLGAKILAESLFRLRTLFPEIEPDDPIVVMSVRTLLYDTSNLESIRANVIDQLKHWDEHYSESDVTEYYIKAVDSWLLRNY